MLVSDLKKIAIKMTMHGSHIIHMKMSKNIYASMFFFGCDSSLPFKICCHVSKMTKATFFSIKIFSAWSSSAGAVRSGVKSQSTSQPGIPSRLPKITGTALFSMGNYFMRAHKGELQKRSQSVYVITWQLCH